MKKIKICNFTRSDEPDIMEMGKFYFLNSKYDEAIKEFENVLTLDPKSSEAYFQIGIAKEAKNESEDAKKMYEMAIKLNPNHKSARERLDKLIGL
jgi:tetratricopeptide (TPR) repeat protein